MTISKPRFTVAGDCVTDNLTGLMWAKNANLAGLKTWQEALDYVASINSKGGCAGSYGWDSSYYGILNSEEGLGGYTDWRLPDVNELESLINAKQANPAAWLNTQGFINAQVDGYWSSTTYYTSTYIEDSFLAWFVNIDAGYDGVSFKANDGYVWPVRSGRAEE
jgi:hypothetical protein